MAMWYRYSRWDGTQDVSPFTADDVMDAMADDLIADGDLRSALQRRMRGIQDLLERLRERKQQQLNRYRLDSLMDDLQKRLEQVVQTERSGIEKRLDQAKGGPKQSPDDQSG